MDSALTLELGSALSALTLALGSALRSLGVVILASTWFKIYVEPLLAFFPCTKALAVKTQFTSLQIVLELADAARESPDRL